MIPTWQEQCEHLSDEMIVTNELIQHMMREEIDELREALKMRELSDEEILKIAYDNLGDENPKWAVIDFARALLKCASGNISSNNEAKD